MEEPMAEQLFYIWSGKEKSWWRPDAAGYTKKRMEAGIYTLAEALSHRLDSTTGSTPGNADVLVPR